MLGRHVGGERKVWRIVRVPSAEAEHRPQPHREVAALKRDRTRITNRIGGLLATVGVLLKVKAESPGGSSGCGNGMGPRSPRRRARGSRASADGFFAENSRTVIYK
jgi:hypothetical protein